MKRLCITSFFLFVSQSSLSGEAVECDDRFDVRATPNFPTSLAAMHAIREGRCTVSVKFNLLESGEIEIVSAIAAEKRCSVFERSAAQSIGESTASAGAKLDGCQTLVSYEFDFDA